MFTLNPQSKDFIATLEFFLKLFGGGGAFYLFLIGLARYKKDQVWKRSEFVAREMKDFTSDKVVQVVMSILDWGARYVELFPDKPVHADRFVRVDRSILKAALQCHTYRSPDPEKIRFTRTEVAIRDHFDHFLSYFERFDQFVVAGLIAPEELKPYLTYWIETISKNMEEDVRNFMHHYIDQYGYRGTQDLFVRFGEDICPRSKIESTRSIGEEKAS